MAENTPVLHRAALERVLLRAAELQAASADVPETLTEAELVALAGEVGISTRALRQALSEERMRVVLPQESGVLAAIAGPANFAAAREVAGEPAALLASIDRAFQREENLIERRRFPDRMVWGARGGFSGAIREVMRFNGRGFPLVRADEVSATVVGAEGGRTYVNVTATLESRRVRAAQRAALGVIVGVGGAAALVAMSVFAPLAIGAGAVVAGGSAWLTRRSYRRDAHAAQLAIEQSLDRLEFGETKRRTLLDQFLISER